MNGFMLHIDATRCTVLRLLEGIKVWVRMWVKVRDGGPARSANADKAPIHRGHGLSGFLVRRSKGLCPPR